MSLTASSILVAITLTAAPVTEAPAATAPSATPMVLSGAVTSMPTAPTPGILMANPPAPEAWTVDAPQQRPGSLPVLYSTLGALNVLDVYSTRRAISAGAYEANPVMRRFSGNTGAMVAVKALSTAGSIYFAEKAWKKNKKGAVIMMAVVNGVTAAVVAHNLRNAR